MQGASGTLLPCQTNQVAVIAGALRLDFLQDCKKPQVLLLYKAIAHGTIDLRSVPGFAADARWTC